MIVTWDEVIGSTSHLPGVTVSTSYGAPALKVNGKLLTRLRPEDGSLVLLDVPPDERDMLIEANPDVFHTTPHYKGSSTVLAAMRAIEPATARLFLERRWCGIAPKRMVSLLDRKQDMRDS